MCALVAGQQRRLSTRGRVDSTCAVGVRMRHPPPGRNRQRTSGQMEDYPPTVL